MWIAICTLLAILKLSQLKAAILFPASRPYSLGAVGYLPFQSLAPMSYASTVMGSEVVSKGKVSWPYLSLVAGSWDVKTNHG